MELTINVEKSSARSTAKQRAKVEKAIHNAHRKSRKEAKSNPQARPKLKKDPGIPNLFPLKDKVLKEIEQRRQTLEQERQAKRQATHLLSGQMQVEESGISKLVHDAAERGIQFEEDMAIEAMEEDDFGGETEMATKKDVSRKTYNKEFKKVVEQADVVLYVLDARDPEGTRSKDIENMIRESPNGEKQLLLILNKVGILSSPLIRLTLIRLDSTRNIK